MYLAILTKFEFEFEMFNTIRVVMYHGILGATLLTNTSLPQSAHFFFSG